MNSLLARIGLPQAIGVYVDEEAIHLSRVVATPLGPREIGRHREEATPEELPDVLARVVNSPALGGGSTRLPVAIGLSAGRTYFSTRPIQIASSNPSPHVLLREALRSSNVSVDEMVVDVIKAQPDKRLVASIAACEREYLKPLLDALQSGGVRPRRAEPAPFALLRLAVHNAPARRGQKVTLRFFLNHEQGQVVLVVNELPIVWRSFALPRGDETSAMLSAARAVMTISKHCGIESDLDAVFLHGRSDLARLLDVQWVEKQMGASLRWCDAPELDDGQIAFGMAVGCLTEVHNAFDLSKSLRPAETLRDIFPWREATLQTAMLVCMALLLGYQANRLNDSWDAARFENQSSATASLPPAVLQKKKKELEAKVTAVQSFLDGRVHWTSYERELAASLPENVYLTSFDGVSELKPVGKNKGNMKPKRSFVLHGAVSMPQDGLVPHEIDRMLDKLRESPLLKENFPLIELAALKQFRGTKDENGLALFTVVCLPKKK